MSQRLRENRRFLDLVKRSSSKIRVVLIKYANEEEVKALAEILLNCESKRNKRKLAFLKRELNLPTLRRFIIKNHNLIPKLLEDGNV